VGIQARRPSWKIDGLQLVPYVCINKILLVGLRRRTRARGEGGICRRHHAALQRRPAWIRGGIAAEGNERITYIAWCDSAIQGFRVNLVALAYGQLIDLIVAVELHRAGRRAAPAAQGACDDRAARRINGHDVCAEYSGDSRRRRCSEMDSRE